MRERARVWSARAILTALALAPLAGLWFVHAHDRIFPYGYVHNALAWLGAVVSYSAAAGLLGLVAFDGFFELKYLAAAARRQPHPPWRARWKNYKTSHFNRNGTWEDVPAYKGPMVTYDKPTPLVRGRIGSR